MANSVSRRGKIFAGVVIFLVLLVVSVLAVGSALGWYEGSEPNEEITSSHFKEKVGDSFFYTYIFCIFGIFLCIFILKYLQSFQCYYFTLFLF